MGRLRQASFWAAVLIIFITIVLMFIVYFSLLQLHSTVDLLGVKLNIHHWFSLFGTLFIAFYTPIYSILKRRYISKIRTLLTIHVFGNLISVLLVSIHFTQQISRPAQFYPDLGTGIALYPTMVLLLITGFLNRFQISKIGGKYWRFIHLSMTLTFYTVIIIHILHGVELI